MGRGERANVLFTRPTVVRKAAVSPVSFQGLLRLVSNNLGSFEITPG